MTELISIEVQLKEAAGRHSGLSGFTQAGQEYVDDKISNNLTFLWEQWRHFGRVRAVLQLRGSLTVRQHVALETTGFPKEDLDSQQKKSISVLSSDLQLTYFCNSNEGLFDKKILALKAKN